jgi:hypothetical protein
VIVMTGPAGSAPDSGLRCYTRLAQQLMEDYRAVLEPADVTRAVVAAAEGPAHLGQPLDLAVLHAVERIARNNLDALVETRRRGAASADPPG